MSEPQGMNANSLTPVDWFGWKSKKRSYRADADTSIDASIRIADSHRSALQPVFDLITSVETRKRARSAANRNSFRRTVEMVLANALWAQHFRVSSTIYYYRAKDKKYEPDWLTPDNLLSALKGLNDSGLVVTTKGQWKGDCSTFVAADHLLTMLSDCGIDERNLHQDPDAVVLVRMKEDGKPVPIDQDAPHVVLIWEPLERYNKFLASHRLELDCSPEEFQSICRSMWRRAFEKSLKLSLRPEVFRTALFRSFAQGRWDRGGRLFGGWWQSIPGDWRSRITVDGEPTSELDFKGFSVRLMYHEMGIPYEEDPYTLNEFGEAGAADFYRDTVKLVLQALINSDGDTKYPKRIRLPVKFPKGLTKRKLRQSIEENHFLIAEKFRIGYGMKIMYRKQ